MIYNPSEEYDSKFKRLHYENTEKYFEELVKKSGIKIDENAKTVSQYELSKDNLKKLKKKCFWWKFLRVILCITLILIPIVIWKLNPIIKALKKEIEIADKKADELLELSHNQTESLNMLFYNRMALEIIEKTIPALTFSPLFSIEQEENMRINFDFEPENSNEQSTIEVLSGNYNENPFLFENKLTHRMGEETYHGSKTIYWTEAYVDGNGKTRTRTNSQTLTASVTKPKPFYSTKLILNYCAQGGPELCFSRDATNLDKKSERAIENYVKKGEKKLKKLNDKALKENSDFMSMSNTEFEVLFDALDRTDEVQYRTLFTPLAQTNMVDLILSKTGYGDDFNFIKKKRTNKIISNHSQSRSIILSSESYKSYSFEKIKENFIKQNTEFFKAVYFDFAPLLAIPIYQERPVHSLKPIPEFMQTYSLKETEALANKIDSSYTVHPETKTEAILKSSFIRSENQTDEINISSFSYDIEKRTDYVSVYGQDGRWHSVPVEWDEYIPLESSNNFFVCKTELAKEKNIIAQGNGLCIYN
ncbi:MAG: hypothetical protein E7621_05985 [Ruminococcaceae bacterium]|nr:hypothetical protein [Oscillospiraceae bacterium]